MGTRSYGTRRVGGVLAAVACVLLTGAAGGAGGPDEASTTPPGMLTSTEGVEVPVHGVVQYRASDGRADQAWVTAAVHGVQRLEGATALYWSAGTRDERGVNSQSLSRTQSQPVRSWNPYNWTGYGALTDLGTLRGLTGSTIDLQTNLSSPSSAFPSDGTGSMWVMFQLFPELPEGTTSVDVTVGTGMVVRDVPVGDGPLTPTLPSDAPVALGAGWPEIDPALLGADPTPDESRFPLSSTRASLDGAQTTTEAPTETTVQLSADVLFAVDSADLGAEAVARLQQLADEIGTGAAPGPLRITGHTDDDADGAYNLDLSQRRAQAVADVLLPRLDVAGLQPVVEGRGETEPVQPNTTDEGKQANRRVTVTYVPDRAEVTP